MLRPDRSTILRGVWLAAAGFPLAVTGASWAAYYALLLQACAACLVKPAQAQALAAAGLSLPLWAAVNVASAVLVTLAYIVVGALIFRRRGHEPRFLFMSGLIMVLGTAFAGFRFDVQIYLPAWTPIGVAMQVAGTTSLFLLILVIPTGRIAPQGTLWPTAYLIMLNASNQFFQRTPLAQLAWSQWGGVGTASFFGPLLISVIAIPAYRYQRVFNQLERQQMKWVLAGLVLSSLALAGLLAGVWSCQRAGQSPRDCSPPTIEQDLISIILPVFLGLAILRSRLFDIDVIIRRTLIYSALTAILALTYFGLVLVLQRLVTALGGRQAEWVTVASTLAVAALILPLRNRVQAFIDKRFYRRKYDAAKTLAAFAAVARDETDLNVLTDKLAGVVQDTMEPESVSVWIKPAAARKPEDLSGLFNQTREAAECAKTRQV